MWPTTGTTRSGSLCRRDGYLIYAIPAIDKAAYNRLGLIVTWADARENSDPAGTYTIVLRGDADNNS